MSKTQPEKKKLSRTALLKSWFIWSAFLHGLYNWERMQAVGFAHTMKPIIDELYKTKEEISQALQRHLVFFNTSPQVGALAAGLVTSMEEQRANGMPIDDETINSVKTSLMGPLAGLGDTITQGMVIPILLAIGISLGLEGNGMGAFIYAVGASVYAYAFSYWAYFQGYKHGGNLVEHMYGSGLLEKLSDAAAFVGLVAAGGLTARYVNFRVLSEIRVSDIATFNIQTQLFDRLVPSFLPLVTVLGLWGLLRKGVKVNHIIWGVFAVGIILGWFGVIG
ncbi:MAG TPA: hypothetical protein DDW87_01125 [Firmicutes bacterium]|nr:hypothetical protein [Bacillota bacterium]